MKGEQSTRNDLTLSPKLNVQDLLALISTADAYRNFIFGNLEPFHEDITAGKFGTDISTEWSKTRESLKRLESAGRSISGLESIWRLRSMSLVGAMMLVVLTMVSIITRWNVWLFYGSFYGALIMLATSGAASYLSNKRIKAYLEEQGSRHNTDMKTIKAFVQKLLNSLSRHFRVGKIDPNKYPFDLYNIDYKGLQVKKNPGFRRTYEVIIDSQ
jgi:hypothetical protein